MYDDDIKKVNEWFDKHEEDSSGILHTGDVYSLDGTDLESFSDFLGDEFPKLCYIQCRLGADGSIWFSESDLRATKFYA